MSAMYDWGYERSRGRWEPHVIEFKSSQRRSAYQDMCVDLQRQLQWYRGEPALDRWQEEFLASLVRQLDDTAGLMAISRKQWAKIHEIQDLIARVDGDYVAEYSEPDDVAIW